MKEEESHQVKGDKRLADVASIVEFTPLKDLLADSADPLESPIAPPEEDGP